MSKKEQEDLEFALAQVLFATGVSFSFLENLYVIEFFQKIRSVFKLSSRSKLANKLLDKVYKKVKKESDNKIANAQSLYMISDGWSNINQESVSNEIIQQIEIVGADKFSVVITDTAINLLINDILKIDETKVIVDNTKNLVKYFKSHPQSIAKLKHIQQENYSKEILLSIKKSKIALEQALMNLESDNSTLSSIYFYFKKIVEKICKISCCFSDELNKLVEEQWEYTYHLIRIVAYILDLQFLETNNPSEEAMKYSEFTTFTK
ncbi:27093_t:CDS:2 [Gigaspora margarita]|uniref:27093_t:CDS:1 n=1 Tax=Gigaspora margarita TaxID=4874 RepID=A0ABN7UMZ7_GIGMA|nr:27093_t:CDS:2 [Gigaspora margarita]